jgi:hypothetical protein
MYEYISEFLKKNKVAVITFTKKDGTIRELFGTLDEGVLPERETPSTREPNKEVFTIWDLDAEGWRSFKIANVISIATVS